MNNLPLNKRKFSAAALKKGFIRNEGKDHIYFTLKTEDGCNTTIRTKISHGSGDDISDSLISKMYKEMRFPTKADFEKYVACTLSEDTYRELIKNK